MIPQLLTPELAAGLPGPDWLVARRTRAATVAQGLPAPTPEAEEWRYSRILDLPGDRIVAVPVELPPGTGVPPAAADLLARLGESCGHIVTVDGVVASKMGCADATAAGVEFGPAGEATPLGAVMSEPHDALAAWNDALTVAPLVLDVPAGVRLASPFVVVHHVAGDATASFPRLVVRAGEASSVAVVEAFVSDEVVALSVPVTEVVVERGAHVRHSVVQDLGARVWQVGALLADVGQEATFESAVAAVGAEYGRLRVDCRLSGRGAAGNVAATYLGGGSQMIDLRTFQDHVAPDTTSDLYFKGAVGDRSHSVYSGLIHIRPGARGTNATQSNRVVKLSEHAWAESVPNLEIENNDVRCSHASAVGPVDVDQRFYLESRGVPPTAAGRLIVRGFFDEAMAHFPVPEVVAPVAARLSDELDRSLSAPAVAG